MAASEEGENTGDNDVEDNFPCLLPIGQRVKGMEIKEGGIAKSGIAAQNKDFIL